MQSPSSAQPDRPPRIVVAGFGLVTSLGHSAYETFAALAAGRTLADRAAALPPDIVPVDLVRALGAVRVAQHVADDPTVELAERAAREAALAAGMDLRNLPTYLGTSKGAVTSLTAAADALMKPTHESPSAPRVGTLPRVGMLPGGPHDYLRHQLQQRLHIAPVTHHVAACASSLTALHAARRQLLTAPPEAPDTALVVSAEASLLPLFIHSYRRLGVLAPLRRDSYRQRPLHRRRRGFMLSETGVAVILKRLAPPPEAASPDHTLEPGEIELLDTAIAAEAYDLIRPSPTMPALRHVAEQLFAGRAIDVLHPHAPGTLEHDAVELAVYRDLLARQQADLPDVYACKGALGHPLGAAGLTALVLACLCGQMSQRPPMVWLTQPMEQADGPPLPLRAEAQSCSRTSTHAIFAAGFAGHVAGAIIQRH